MQGAEGLLLPAPEGGSGQGRARREGGEKVPHCRKGGQRGGKKSPQLERAVKRLCVGEGRGKSWRKKYKMPLFKIIIIFHGKKKGKLTMSAGFPSAKPLIGTAPQQDPKVGNYSQAQELILKRGRGTIPPPPPPPPHRPVQLLPWQKVSLVRLPSTSSCNPKALFKASTPLPSSPCLSLPLSPSVTHIHREKERHTQVT